MELLAVILFVFLPGFIVGLPLGLWLFRGLRLASNLMCSIVLGLFFALVVAPLVNSTYHRIKTDREESQFKERVEPERRYFASALAGVFDEADIRNH